MKIVILITLIFFVCSAWSQCDSCGVECAGACHTRRFRACCLNYMRRKREPHHPQIHSLGQDVEESQMKSELPVYIIERLPVSEDWKSKTFSSQNYPYSLEDMFENRLD